MWKKHVFSNKKLSSMEINGGFSTSRVYHQNGSFLDDFHILEDPTLTRPCVYTYGMIWVDGHICSWFTHKKWMLIFHSFLYVYQRVYVLLYIVYIYLYMQRYIDIDITCVQNGLSPHPRSHSGNVFWSSSLAMVCHPRWSGYVGKWWKNI